MDSDAHLKDESVAKRALTDKNSFAILVQRYEAKLLRYIKRLGVFGQEDAEDVLQNTFISAYRNLNSFDSTLSFSSWIYRIAHNESISFFRKTRARPQGHYVENNEDVLARIKDSADTASLAEQHLNLKSLSAALANIDRKYRDVLVLRYFEEREYKEISDILKVPKSTVGTLLRRGKAALQKQLNKPT